MNDPTKKKISTPKSPLGWVGAVFGTLLVLLVLAVAAIYIWPLGSDELRQAQPKSFDFGAAVSEAQQVVETETANPEVLPDCRSQILTHGNRTAKAVLLLHGYTDCPKQYASLAKLYFDQGYNVWVPRAPRHGLTDQLAHAKLEASELVTYANDGLNLAAGLGDDVGVVGISGGGVLATWLAEYRTDAVHHLLLLSPFYEPNSAQAPSFAVKPLIVLFGFRILPDHLNSNGFSYAALAQYLRIFRNFKSNPKTQNLRSIAVVTSANDTFINRQRAVEVSSHIAEINNLSVGVHEIPAEFEIGHDIVDPEGLKDKVDQLNKIYFDLYEGRS